MEYTLENMLPPDASTSNTECHQLSTSGRMAKDDTRMTDLAVVSSLEEIRTFVTELLSHIR